MKKLQYTFMTVDLNKVPIIIGTYQTYRDAEHSSEMCYNRNCQIMNRLKYESFLNTNYQFYKVSRKEH